MKCGDKFLYTFACIGRKGKYTNIFPHTLLVDISQIPRYATLKFPFLNVDVAAYLNVSIHFMKAATQRT